MGRKFLAVLRFSKIARKRSAISTELQPVWIARELN